VRFNDGTVAIKEVGYGAFEPIAPMPERTAVRVAP